MSDFDREFGWEDAIENDGDFVIVPEGDYNFRVLKFERARHAGSEKLPPCNKAILTIEVSNGNFKTVVTHNLFLHSKCEGMLCSFFTAIGQRKHGEKLVPKWNEIVGSTGTCKVIKENWTGNNGQSMESNRINKFYPKDSGSVSAPVPVSGVSYTPGSF